MTDLVRTIDGAALAIFGVAALRLLIEPTFRPSAVEILGIGLAFVYLVVRVDHTLKLVRRSDQA